MAECMYWKEITVHWGESDPFGLVYYPRIVAWFNETEHEFFRTIGFPIDQMIREDRTTFVMGEIHFRFIGPAAYGDRIATTITLAKISERTLHWACKARKCGHRRAGHGRDAPRGSTRGSTKMAP
jgi:YbgC/YbaW family acyl-CoA thioester hydrolase